MGYKECFGNIFCNRINYPVPMQAPLHESYFVIEQNQLLIAKQSNALALGMNGVAKMLRRMLREECFKT